MISISSIASPEPQIVTIDDDSNEPTMPYGFGRQLPIVPPSLNNLNLPSNPFKILATMIIANNTRADNGNNYSPESPDPSVPSSISTPPNERQCLQQLGDVIHYHQRQHIPLKRQTQKDIFPSSKSLIAAITSTKAEKKVEPGNVFSKRRGGSVAAHLRRLRSDDPLNKGHHRSI